MTDTPLTTEEVLTATGKALQTLVSAMYWDDDQDHYATVHWFAGVDMREIERTLQEWAVHQVGHGRAI